MFALVALLTVPGLLMVRFFPSATAEPVVNRSKREVTPLSVPVWFALAGVSMFSWDKVRSGHFWRPSAMLPAFPPKRFTPR